MVSQNARVHGFYSRVLDETDRLNVKRAASVQGLAQEIDLLRAKIISVVQHDPDNVRLISQAVVSLARLLRTQHHLGQGNDKNFSLREVRENVYNDIARPLGIDRDKFFNPADSFTK